MLAGLALLYALAVPGEELVVNGDFEAKPTEEASVPGWVIEEGAMNGVRQPVSEVAVDEDEKHAGRRSLHLSGRTSTRLWLIAKQEVEARPGGRYRLSSHAKTSGVVREGIQFNNCYVGLFLFDDGGAVVAKQYRTPTLPDSGWEKLEIELSAPASVRSAQVLVFLSMTGDLWVDDLALEIEGGEALPAPELVFEEGFEKSTRLPSRWRKEVGATNGASGEDSRVEVDVEQGAPDSSRSLKLSGDADTRRWYSVNRELKAQPGELYRLRAMARAADVRQEGIQFENLHMRIAFLDRKGESLSPTHYAHLGPGTVDWTELEVEGISPEGTSKVLAGFFLSMSGEVWFDDIALTRQGGFAPPYSDWQTIETRKVVLRYPPDHPQAKQMKGYALRLDQAKEHICDALGVTFEEKITVFLYRDNDHGRQMLGRDLDFADPGGRRVHQRHNSYIGHEMVHVIAHTQLQYGKTGILGEGIAVWLNGQAPQAHHGRAAELLKEGELPSVESLVNSFRDQSLGYPAAGSFCGFLLEAYGLAFFKEVYPLEDPSSRAKELTGKSFPEMEADWHELLKKYR